MPYTTIISDLDGTLLNGERRLGDYTRDVLRWLHATERTIILASGRHYIDMAAIRDRLAIPMYLISSNGAQITAPDGTILHTRTLAAEYVQQLVALGRQHGVHMNLHFGDRWLVEEANPVLLEAHKDSGFAYQVEDFGNGALEGVIKFFFIGENAALQNVEASIKSLAIASELQVVFAESTDLQVMAKGVGKGAAVNRVMTALGHSPEQLIAFGDGMNDCDMLNYAGRGVVMENAMPALKQALPHLAVIGHHRDEAVASYLAEKFGYPYQARQAA